MSTARVIEIAGISASGFHEAIEEALTRATATLRNVKSAWVKEQRVILEDDAISSYQVNLLVTFIIEE